MDKLHGLPLNILVELARLDLLVLLDQLDLLG
jgi:hypothetical protein